MDIQNILAHCDHTLLNPTATWPQIRTLCDEGMAYHTASVCIPASFVRQAREYVGNRLKICTVIGFPNGYDTTAAKCFMAVDAISNGADEIDMVANLGWIKEGDYDALCGEIAAVKGACGDKILKVIVETCLLTEDEKIAMCKTVGAAGADYIKTSTGFSSGGATFDDVNLFSRHVGKQVKIKAAGGISTFDDAVKFMNLGADRLGTSRLIRLLRQYRSQEE